jgi:hypothetical protein
VIAGALCEPFLQALLSSVRALELTLVVADSTKVFLTDHGLDWYGRRGLTICVLDPIRLCAITVNPQAPRSHNFDSAGLCAAIEAAVPDVPVLDVRRTAGAAVVCP